MCDLESVLCAVFRLCYVQFAVTRSSLRSEHVSLRSVGRMHACICSNLVNSKVVVQICWGGRSSKQEMRYRHICMFEFLFFVEEEKFACLMELHMKLHMELHMELHGLFHMELQMQFRGVGGAPHVAPCGVPYGAPFGAPYEA